MNQDKLHNQILATIENDFSVSSSSKSGMSTKWSDNNKAFRGDHWNMSISYRSPATMKRRPNSVDNYVFGLITYKKIMLSGTTPEPVITFIEENKEKVKSMETQDVENDEQGETYDKSKKLTKLVEDVMYKNNFPLVWENIVFQALSHGQFIGMCLWDNDKNGGSGKDRYLGDISTPLVDNRDFFPDPAITNLEMHLQECDFIIVRLRKKLSYFKKRFKDKANLVMASESNGEVSDERYEGMDSNLANLYMHFHKGEPKEVTKKYKDIWKEKMELSDNYFEKERYQQMIDGTLDGVHLAMSSDGVLLDYIPYVYDDGLYPIAYAVVHIDSDSQWGFGEIEQIKIPQVNHNKADEIQLEAMSKQGLGGFFYNKGSVSIKQLGNILKNMWKGGQALEVNDITGIRDRTGASVPNSVIEYKDSKESAIGNIGGYIGVQRGEVKSGTPFASVQALGMRADVRTDGISSKAEVFMKQLTHLIVNRCMQFYDDDRKFRVKDKEGIYYETFNKGEFMQEWERETEDGNTEKERYLPEYDIKVVILDEKPNNREYNINLAFKLAEMGIMDTKTVLEVIESGVFPKVDKILSRIDKMKNEQMQEQMALEQGGQPQPQQQGQAQPSEQEIMQLTQGMPDNVKQYVVNLAENDMAGYQQFIDELMNMSEEERQQVYAQL